MSGMTLVERLRLTIDGQENSPPQRLNNEAADEIDRLTSELAEAKAALQKYEGATKYEVRVRTSLGRAYIHIDLPAQLADKLVTVWVKRRKP